MSFESRLFNTIRSLPRERQAEVLDFAEFIKLRTGGTSESRPVGLCEGEFVIPDDFDAPLPESVLSDFES